MRFFLTSILLVTVSIFNLFSLPSKLLEDLSLSDEQKAKIEEIMVQNELKVEELLIDLQIKQYELKKLLLNENVKKEDLKNALLDIADTEAEIRYLKYVLELDILTILDKEQRMRYKIYKINNDKDKLKSE